jgi:hypothetical protein
MISGHPEIAPAAPCHKTSDRIVNTRRDPISGAHRSTLLEAEAVKYVLLIYQATKDYNPQSLTENEYKEVAAQYGAVVATPNLKPGLPVGLPRDAVTVRVRDGEAVTTPGPYAEQPVGGYCEFEAETLEEAIQLAARIPAASRGGAVEVRPSRKYW